MMYKYVQMTLLRITIEQKCKKSKEFATYRTSLAKLLTSGQKYIESRLYSFVNTQAIFINQIVDFE